MFLKIFYKVLGMGFLPQKKIQHNSWQFWITHYVNTLQDIKNKAVQLKIDKPY